MIRLCRVDESGGVDPDVAPAEPEVRVRLRSGAAPASWSSWLCRAHEHARCAGRYRDVVCACLCHIDDAA